MRAPETGDPAYGEFFSRVLRAQRLDVFTPIFQRGDVALILDEEYENCPGIEDLCGSHTGPVVAVSTERALALFGPELHDFVKTPATAKIVVATHGLFYPLIVSAAEPKTPTHLRLVPHKRKRA